MTECVPPLWPMSLSATAARICQESVENLPRALPHCEIAAGTRG